MVKLLGPGISLKEADYAFGISSTFGIWAPPIPVALLIRNLRHKGRDLHAICIRISPSELGGIGSFLGIRSDDQGARRSPHSFSSNISPVVPFPNMFFLSFWNAQSIYFHNWRFKGGDHILSEEKTGIWLLAEIDSWLAFSYCLFSMTCIPLYPSFLSAGTGTLTSDIV